jgi:hypothetical protein
MRFRLKPEARFAHQNLRQILLAIEGYHDLYNVLPYHPNGSDCALFLLHDMMDASCLACMPPRDRGRQPYWDFRQKRAANCGWEYLNQRDLVAFDPSEIVVTSRRITGWKTVLIGLKSGVLALEFEEYPGRSLLGATLMDDLSIRKPGGPVWTKGDSNPAGNPRAYRRREGGPGDSRPSE